MMEADVLGLSPDPRDYGSVGLEWEAAGGGAEKGQVG